MGKNENAINNKDVRLLYYNNYMVLQELSSKMLCRIE
jgi:hypothetical protein